MKTIYLSIVLCVLATSIVITAPSKTQSTRSVKILRASSIVQMKKLKFTSPAKLVKEAGKLSAKIPPRQSFPISNTDDGTPTGHEAYRTGDGLVLKPNAITHTGSGSHLSLGYVDIGRYSIGSLTGDSSRPSLDMFFPSGRDIPPVAFGVGWFNSLPSGQHTYIVTLGIHADNARDHIMVSMGNDEYRGDDLFYTESTGEIRLLFSYDAGARDNDNRLTICVTWEHNDTTRDWYYQELQFYYIQLAQLD